MSLFSNVLICCVLSAQVWGTPLQREERSASPSLNEHIATGLAILWKTLGTNYTRENIRLISEVYRLKDESKAFESDVNEIKAVQSLIDKVFCPLITQRVNEVNCNASDLMWLETKIKLYEAVENIKNEETFQYNKTPNEEVEEQCQWLKENVNGTEETDEALRTFIVETGTGSQCRF